MTTPTLDRIEQKARSAEKRLRMRRAILWGAKALLGVLFVALVLMVFRKTGVTGERFTRIAIGVDAAVLVAVVVAAWFARLPRRAGAVALDRSHGLSDRLSSALAFGELPAAERTPFMTLAMDDAVKHAEAVSPKRAVPMILPDELIAIVVMMFLIGGVGLFEVRQHQPIA